MKTSIKSYWHGYEEVSVPRKSQVKSYGLVLGLALVMTAIAQFCSPVRADQSKHSPGGLPAAAVIFSAYEDYKNGEPVGYVVYNSQSSPNAPKIEVGSAVADDLELLLAQGFQLQSSDGFVFRLVRPARTVVMD